VERGLPQTTDLDTLQVQLPSLNIELPLPASIPADYVPDRQVRLNLYRRIVNLRASLEIEALIEELNDRFGTPPETVFNLLFQVRIRHQAEKAGLNSISGEANQIAIRYPDGKVPEVLPNLGQFARIGKTAVWFSYQQTPSWQQELVKILDVLVEYSQNHHGALSKVSIFDDTVS
jgi:transcription-repair coupling factor (superfamily II helicase)